jgi:general secretion pathway protein B
VESKVAGRASTSDTGPEQDTAHIPEPIGYWELPDAIRAEVPEIRFTVLVYNQDPEQRFVLIDGQRLAEGDSAQPGLLVQEIRRDGVIFSYRLYKFLVKR